MRSGNPCLAGHVGCRNAEGVSRELYGGSDHHATPRLAFLKIGKADNNGYCDDHKVEGRQGKLRIQLKGASVSDLAMLSRALWEAAS
jgi:hypothetical protein